MKHKSPSALPFCTQGSSCHNLRVTCSAGAELPSHTVGSILMYASLAVLLHTAVGSVETVVEFKYVPSPHITQFPFRVVSTCAGFGLCRR